MIKHLFIALTAIVILLACTTSRYTLETNKVYNNANMMDYTTFSFMKPDAQELPTKITAGDYVKICEAISNSLKSRGMKHVQKGELLINIGLYERQNIETKDVIPSYAPRYYGRRYYSGANYYNNAQVITDINREGFLTVDFIDAKKDMHVYEATISSILDKSANGGVKDLSELQKAIEVLLSKYPIPLPTASK